MNDRNGLHSSRKLRTTLHLAALTGTLALAVAGCKHDQTASAQTTGQDPANANLAQPYTGGDAGGYGNGQTRVAGQSQSYTPQSSGESYETQTPAPIIRQAPAGAAVNNTQYYPVPQAQSGSNGYASDANYQGYDDAEEAGEQALAETDQAPPPLPEYDQPPAPADNYLWTPGYWDYASTGYYWVPGVWCAPPFYGALWTPPYWGYSGSHYLFHRGYWGPHVGYYGGINYGFGYIGFGYFGGYWRDHNFYYNRAVTNVNVGYVHNVYSHTVIYNNRTYGPRPDVRISYNGGRGGLNVQPRPQELAAMHEAHYAPLPAQRENRVAASGNRSQFYTANQGRPAQAFAARPVGAVNNIAATPREQAFNHPGTTTQPGVAGRPGEANRPGTAPNQPAFAGRPGEANRPGTINNQPGFAGRPGEANRPGTTPNQPGFAGRPGEANRPGTTPNQPGFAGRPGEANRLGGTAAQPGFNNGRTNAPGSQPAFNRGAQPNQPAYGNRPAPTPGQPAAEPNRAGGFNRGAQPNQPALNNRPEATQPAPGANRPGDFNRGAQPNQARPNVEQRAPQPQAQPQQRPNFEQRAPQAQPQAQQQRPSFQQRAPQPQTQAQPQARPQAAAPARPAAPAPHAEAPRGGGGQPHEHKQ